MAAGKEPGTIPASRTPTTTPEHSIATMRALLQKLDTTTVERLQRNIDEHSKTLGDVLTTMRVQVQPLTSPARNAWLISADSVEDDLDRLVQARGEELRIGFTIHRKRLLRLLEEFRALVPAKPEEPIHDR